MRQRAFADPSVSTPRRGARSPVESPTTRPTCARLCRPPRQGVSHREDVAVRGCEERCADAVARVIGTSPSTSRRNEAHLRREPACGCRRSRCRGSPSFVLPVCFGHLDTRTYVRVEHRLSDRLPPHPGIRAAGRVALPAEAGARAGGARAGAGQGGARRAGHGGRRGGRRAGRACAWGRRSRPAPASC